MLSEINIILDFLKEPQVFYSQESVFESFSKMWHTLLSKTTEKLHKKGRRVDVTIIFFTKNFSLFSLS